MIHALMPKKRISTFTNIMYVAGKDFFFTEFDSFQENVAIKSQVPLKSPYVFHETLAVLAGVSSNF